jgi:RTA1 like protein
MAPLVAATVYMTLGAFVKALNLRQYLSIPPQLTTCFYVIVDIGCFITQIFGSIMPASGDPDSIQLAQTLIIGGLIAQLAALTLFLFSTMNLHRLANRHLPSRSYDLPYMQKTKKYFFVTYGVTATMMLRSLVRGIEYLQGEESFILKHEVFVYLFDALLIAAIAVSYMFVHPGRMLRNAQRARSRRDKGMVELLEPGSHR